MKHFFDTEFIEHAGGIQIVSLGIYSPNFGEIETHKSLYLESSSFDHRLADNWVKENVLKKLEWVNENGFYKDIGNPGGVCEFASLDDEEKYAGSIPENMFAQEILEYLKNDPSPEFYAYFASYDWVVFARLFGRLIDKPANFPMWVIDLKQMMWERGLTKEWKHAHCPDPEGEHNALVDARWNYKLYQEIIKTRNTLTQKVGDMTYTWFPDSEMFKP